MSKRQFLFWMLILGSLTAYGPLSIDMYLPAFTAISRDLDVSVGQVEQSLASFFIGMSVGQLLYGTLSDRYGRKLPLYIGLVVFLISSVACTFAHSIESLVFWRFLQALGACSGQVISRAMIRDLFDVRQSAFVFSLLMLVTGVAPILAPLVGGMVIQFWPWQAIFGILALFSLTSLLTVGFGIQETHPPDPSVKLERTFHTYWDILKDKQFLCYALTGGFAQGGMFAYITSASFVFIELFKIPPSQFGWIFGANAIGLIACSQINGLLVKRFEPGQILKFVIPAIALSGITITVSAFTGAKFWGIAIPLFCYVSCLGLTFPNSMSTALVSQKERAGAASALVGSLQFGLAALTAALVSYYHNETVLPMAIAMCVCGCLSVLVYGLLKPSSRVGLVS